MTFCVTKSIDGVRRRKLTAFIFNSKMAGNFWQSSHNAQWLLQRVDLLRERHADLQMLSEDEYQKIIIFFAGFIQTLGEQLK